MQQTHALLIVDVQNDFFPGGAVPVPEAESVVPVLNSYARWFAEAHLTVFVSRLWHPVYSRQFASTVERWPRYSIRDTPGAAFHPDLYLPEGAVILSHGMDPRGGGYSLFQSVDEDRQDFMTLLRCGGIRELYVGGLFVDDLIRLTVLDALGRGLRVHLLTDAVRGKDSAVLRAAVTEMITKGAIRTVYDDLPALVR